VHAPVSLASLWLAPKLLAFTAAYPADRCPIVVGDLGQPRPDESTDLEIRYGSGQWRGYRAERLLNQRIVAVCSPADARGARVRRARRRRWSARRHLIHIMGHENHWLKVRQALQLRDQPARPGPTVDTTLAALELAASGAGCALAQLPLDGTARGGVG
jgi:LysR family glycine cleavage system transcriptional activator